MENLTEERRNLVTSFLEITAQSADTAQQFLQATNWKLDEAIQLFFVGSDGVVTSHAPAFVPLENATTLPGQLSSAMVETPTDNAVLLDETDGVRAPLPVKRDILYDDALLYRSSRMGHQLAGFPPADPSTLVAFRNFNEEMKHPGVWEAEQNPSSSADTSRDNLASLYRPPFALMHQGPFEKAKQAASVQDKWLLVNIQSTTEFSSHMLNRDTWANEAVAQTITTNFIFWQVYDDTTEGRKVCTYYKLENIPAVLVIDPITGQKMRAWSGMVSPDTLLEDLLAFMDSGPKNHHVSLPNKRPRENSHTSAPKVLDEDEELRLALAASMQTTKDSDAPAPTEETAPEIVEPDTPVVKVPEYPPLPVEPKDGDKSLICRVGVRLPDGRRLQRYFLRSDPIQLLWSFCSSELDEAKVRPLLIKTQAIVGVSNSLEYESKLTFEESGIANAMVSAHWE
ncbi:hypothetical protein ACHQM5_005249 [Ranunculus cassubicifolius]